MTRPKRADNKPSELEMLRRVASAAAWAIASNGDDVVGKDGRSRVGINWVMANGALNRAIKQLEELYTLENYHDNERSQAMELAEQLYSRKRA